MYRGNTHNNAAMLSTAAAAAASYPSFSSSSSYGQHQHLHTLTSMNANSNTPNNNSGKRAVAPILKLTDNVVLSYVHAAIFPRAYSRTMLNKFGKVLSKTSSRASSSSSSSPSYSAKLSTTERMRRMVSEE